MAKKDKKDSKQDDAPTPADAVRGAVEQAFAATFGGAASTRGIAQDLVEEIGSATSRVRQAIDELRVVDDLRALRSELEALNKRVESLEAAKTASPPPKRPRASAGTKPAGTKPAASRARSAAAARKDAAAKPAKAAKAKTSTPRSAASARKAPAASRRRSPPPGAPSVASEFRSEQELREVMDLVWSMMSEDPDMGPKLREADVPQRFEFSDFDLVCNIRAAKAEEEGHLHWEWSDDVDWEPKVRMTMSSETANKYFQGKENVAMAIARRRIKTGGDVKAALALMPITKPVFDRYRDLVAVEYPHLKL